jgi:hypothetical protein
MTRFLVFGLMAVAALAVVPTASSAQSPFGCGICICTFGRLHQHGPLYNYGPYAGYYPFAPYGPWNSDLSYNGGNCNGGNCGLNLRMPQLLNRGCNTCGPQWGRYAMSTWKNVFNRTHPCSAKAGCSSCGS